MTTPAPVTDPVPREPPPAEQQERDSQGRPRGHRPM
jgi:hypothetical protein